MNSGSWGRVRSQAPAQSKGLNALRRPATHSSSQIPMTRRVLVMVTYVPDPVPGPEYRRHISQGRRVCRAPRPVAGRDRTCEIVQSTAQLRSGARRRHTGSQNQAKFEADAEQDSNVASTAAATEADYQVASIRGEHSSGCRGRLLRRESGPQPRSSLRASEFVSTQGEPQRTPRRVATQARASGRRGFE